MSTIKRDSKLSVVESTKLIHTTPPWMTLHKSMPHYKPYQEKARWEKNVSEGIKSA